MRIKVFTITKTWILIPQNDKTYEEICQFLLQIETFASEITIEWRKIPNATPSGFYYVQSKPDFLVSTNSDENEGMIRLCMGANYDLFLKKSETSISYQ